MIVPDKRRKGRRVYGDWAGNPDGHLEDLTRCIAEVRPPVGWGSGQCTRLRGHGPNGEYCKQHGKIAMRRTSK